MRWPPRRGARSRPTSRRPRPRAPGHRSSPRPCRAARFAGTRTARGPRAPAAARGTTASPDRTGARRTRASPGGRPIRSAGPRRTAGRRPPRGSTAGRGRGRRPFRASSSSGARTIGGPRVDRSASRRTRTRAARSVRRPGSRSALTPRRPMLGPARGAAEGPRGATTSPAAETAASLHDLGMVSARSRNRIDETAPSAFYDLGTEVPPSLRLADASAELALAI